MMPATPTSHPWTRLTWLWFAFRCAAAAVLAFVFLLFAGGAVTNTVHLKLNPGTAVLYVCTALFGAPLWLLARNMRAAWRAGVAPERMKSELKIVLAVFGIFAVGFALAWPSLSGRLRVSREDTNKANLVSLRQTVNTYAAAHDGVPPDSLEALVFSGDLLAMPPLSLPRTPHPRTTASIPGDDKANDTGLWGYRVDDDPEGPVGAVYIDCTHTDSKGNAWAAY